MADGSQRLRILHFNDVYHVSGSGTEPVGGAARFGTMLHALQSDPAAGPTLTLFSGDAYFPSLESSISHGRHMVPVLNRLSIDASTFGNHEFDQGIDRLEGLIKDNNFPWVITNLTDKTTGDAAAKGSVQSLVKEVGGIRVGIIGIIEREWLDTLPCLPPTFEYHDFIESARKAAVQLKDPAGAACDLVVCLSHMRLPNDIKLADACGDVVDLVLGGHDHFYYIGSGVAAFEDPDLSLLPEKYADRDDDRGMLETWTEERASLPPGSSGRRLVKSGTDFRELSEIVLELEKAAEGTRIGRATVKRHRTTSAVPEDPEIKSMVSRIEEHLSKALDKVVGFTTVDLDARSTVCRTRESNLGSLSGDLMRLCYAESAGAQIALLCGGAIRSDKVFAAGQVCMRNIMEVFPFEDPVVVVRLTGNQIRRALENGVSKWPAHEGRFPQVSGIRFEFDPEREPGSRVTSIVITAEAKSAAKRGSTQADTAPVAARQKTPKKSETSMHRLAVENAAAGATPSHRNSIASVDSETETESDYGDEEDEPLDMDTHYIVATRDYMYQGHDGYDALNEGELVVDEENGISFSNLYERYFRGLAVSNALRFSSRGYATDCSSARHALLQHPESHSDAASSTAGSTNGSAWKRMIIKHADDLRALAQHAKNATPEKSASTTVGADRDADSLAAKIASVIVRYNNSIAEKSELSKNRCTKIVKALLSSAKRLRADQDPLRIARSALFGHEDSSLIPLPEPENSSDHGTPRNDDAGGLLPDLLVNRKDTRSYTSESLLAHWAVISPQTDGRIRNIAAPDA